MTTETRNARGEVCIVCDWKDADPFPRFIEAEIAGKSVSLEWRDRADGLKELVVPVSPTAAIAERVAVLTAHRACHSAEHDPENGRLHGYCIVCGVPFPCAYAGEPAAPPPAAAQQQGQAVAWHTEDHLADKSATTYDPVVRDRWIAKGWPVTPLYTAPPRPEASAPVGVDLSKLQRHVWSSRGWEPDPKGPLVQFKDIEALAQQPAAVDEAKARTGTVADIADDHLLSRAVRAVAKRRSRTPKLPAWSRVSDVFALGSTYSAQLCRRFGVDPETGKSLATQHQEPTT